MSRVTRAFLVTTLLALLAAAVLHNLALAGWMRAWPALVHLAIYGWISGMILTVNYHMLPVFSGRDYPTPWLLAAHWLSFSSGIALATLGLLLNHAHMTLGGIGLQLGASLLFSATTVQLFRRGTRRRTPPPPVVADQRTIDRIATQATRHAGMCLPLSLLLLLLTLADRLGPTWLLAAEHLATLGWLMLMVVGVGQHVLPRYSGRPVRGSAWSRAQLHSHTLALLLMVPALGLGWAFVFAAGALLMTLALALFAWNIWPTLVPLRSAPRSRQQEPAV
ncbi:hypothetical protein [Kallotenue papyrolyticum]|uniref:hypothetical protein n=1 Tax=Kallotenue papyrolyticum TaxID=1325125 RepID=UPI0004AF50FE|nr:hypothetical protein [Kallotenue papyrolyticum]